MASFEYTLAAPPEEPRQRDLWLQHAAGFILMEEIRREAIDQIPPSLPEATRAIAVEAVDAAMYRLMGLIDGVIGELHNAEYAVNVRMHVRLQRWDGQSDAVVEDLDLQQGDGMSMGIHGWMEGNYGRNPVVEGKVPPPAR